MATQLPSPARAGIVWAPRAQTWAVGALVAVLCLQLSVVFSRAINWDEFYHYSLIHQLSDGTLSTPLQTLFTRVFVWVTALPGTGVDHIVLIRLFMFAFELVTIAAMVGMASRFTDRTTAVLCALAYVSAGFVFRHGTSFRFDPPAAALLVSALYLMLKRPLDARTIVLTGLLLGTATMWTMKSVLYLPAFAGVLWLRWSEHGFSRDYILRASAMGGVTVCAFGALFLLHSDGLAGNAGDESQRLVSAAATKMFSVGNQLYWPHVVQSAKMAPLLAILILAFPIFLWRNERAMAERLALLGLFLPIMTLLIYHNTAAYYYVFMLPPVAVACCIVMGPAVVRYGAAAISAVLLLNAAIILATEPKGVIDRQRMLVRAADEIFEQPVLYFDSNAMLGHFPKANVFMTPWGAEQYLAGALPSLRETLATRTVPLAIADQGRFAGGWSTPGPNPFLLPDDLAALRSTYVPFWGPFWIAGELVPADGQARVEDFLVPGPFTVRDAPMIIDGRTYSEGAVVDLARGPHRLQAASRLPARLIWGDRLKAPAAAPPPEPYWSGF